MAGSIVQGFETRTVAALAVELASKALESMELAAPRVEERLRLSASKYTDTGDMENSISVTPYGGLGGFGVREVGMIASATAQHAEWVDRGTRSPITPTSTSYLSVGKRTTNNPASKGFGGTVYKRDSVSGQEATHWFSAPGGIPLNEIMRNTYAGIFRRLK